ncbi:roadblock/LC7 domain-containing protein [Kineococcus radiotolerans]|uniref:Roadblock/LC7 family protein n=1 Tax=Kineococcus radiotolerans (strain ATCC BAA-149 / DSM 14245 / SRS30216) TaxID=266940 RepID=A6WCG6_KINRD|nr:Roadblock/LC7 family protein [Kineococcus radiotolerans SRS30216 = ATCC BAA-149]
MIVKQHAIRAGTTLRRDIPGVQRVLVARTDGLAFHDDGPERDHESTAAVVATVLGIAQRAAADNALGPFLLTTVKGADGCLAVYAVGATHVLAVVTDPSVNLVLLDRLALRLVAELAGAETGAPSVARAR